MSDHLQTPHHDGHEDDATPLAERTGALEAATGVALDLTRNRIQLASRVEAETVDRRPAAVYLARLAPSGRRTMRGALNMVAGMLTGGQVDAMAFPWHQLRYEHTQGIRAALAERYAPATANKHLSALRGTLKAAWRLGLVSAEDYERACDLEPVRGTTLPAGRRLDRGEITALFDTCAAGAPADIRDAALLAVLYGSGLRREEAVDLDLDDYQRADTQLRVNGKGSKERLAHLASGADAALDAWIDLRGDQPGPLFVPINKAGRLEHRRLSGQAVRLILRKRARLAGVADFSPHDARRTFVSELLDQGADIAVVADLAGHASVTTTARYDRRGDEAKRDAARLLHVPYRQPSTTTTETETGR